MSLRLSDGDADVLIKILFLVLELLVFLFLFVFVCILEFDADADADADVDGVCCSINRGAVVTTDTGGSSIRLLLLLSADIACLLL